MTLQVREAPAVSTEFDAFHSSLVISPSSIPRIHAIHAHERAGLKGAKKTFRGQPKLALITQTLEPRPSDFRVAGSELRNWAGALQAEALRCMLPIGGNQNGTPD